MAKITGDYSFHIEQVQGGFVATGKLPRGMGSIVTQSNDENGIFEMIADAFLTSLDIPTPKQILETKTVKEEMKCSGHCSEMPCGYRDCVFEEEVKEDTKKECAKCNCKNNESCSFCHCHNTFSKYDVIEPPKEPVKKLCYCGHPKETHTGHYMPDWFPSACKHCPCQGFALNETK